LSTDDAPTTAESQPRPRRSRAVPILTVGVLAVAAGGGGAWIAGRDGDPAAAEPVSRAVPTTTAIVGRRDLVDRHDLDGTLTFAGERRVAAPVEGTITRLRTEGSVVSRGQSLLALDDRATAFVLYGHVPMYRDLRSGVDDGDDIRQLQRNLAALGYDPYGALVADGEWDQATTDAVRRWQEARDVTEDGVVARGDVLFADGPVRVGSHDAEVGDRASPGGPVLTVSSTRRVVTARLPAGRQDAVDAGDRVDVTLPDGRVVRGEVSSVGRVAKQGEDGGEATVSLRVRLRGALGRTKRLDRAPVTISLTTSAARDALSVPVTALLARGGGRYAVEQPGGRLIPVRTGVFADGYVEVSGALRSGNRVVVPR
jgi:hypothetical protein